jgi:hypothetical protein
MGRGRGQIIFYNCAQSGHLTRDCHNPCTTCNYCNSFDHVIEYCPVLLSKLQERRRGNKQVQLISTETHDEDPRVVVITRGGIVTGEDKVTPVKIAEGSGIRRALEKAQLFEPRRERHTFEDKRKEFVEGQASSSKAQPKGNVECVRKTGPWSNKIK